MKEDLSNDVYFYMSTIDHTTLIQIKTLVLKKFDVHS